MKKFFVAIWKNFWIWLLYFFIWLLYEFLGENMLLYYWYLGWNKHFRITFSKHRLPKASTNARVALFKIDLQPRGSNVHIMVLLSSLLYSGFPSVIHFGFIFQKLISGMYVAIWLTVDNSGCNWCSIGKACSLLFIIITFPRKEDQKRFKLVCENCNLWKWLHHLLEKPLANFEKKFHSQHWLQQQVCDQLNTCIWTGNQ